MTGRRLALYVATGCLAYAAALVALLPAPWMAQTVGRLSNQTLQLRDPDGTIWAGRGELYARQGSGALIDLGSLRWKTSPAGILFGKLPVALAIGEQANIAHVDFSAGSTTVRGLNLALPGTILASFVPGIETLGPQGKILIRSDNLRIDTNSFLGLADIEWRSVRLARAQGLDLGSHIAHLRGGGSKIDIELGTVEGALRLSGAGTWTPERGLSVAGALEHGEDRTATIGPFLQGICSEYRPGRCAFRFGQ